MDMSNWSQLRSIVFVQSQQHREHWHQVRLLYNESPDWHRSMYVKHYRSVYVNLEDMQIFIDTVSTQMVALCTRSILENYITVAYLKADPKGTAKAEYGGKSLIGNKEAKECFLLLAEHLGEITAPEKAAHQAESDRTIAQKQIEMNVPDLPEKSTVNYFAWAEAVNDPRLVIIIKRFTSWLQSTCIRHRCRPIP